MKCSRDLLKKKKMINNMNSKITNNYQELNLKTKTKNKLSKQLEQEQNHRNGDHMEGYQWEEVGREWGKRYRE